MKIDDRRVAQGLGGIAALCLLSAYLAPAQATLGIGVGGFIAGFVALGIRLRTPDSRSRQRQGCVSDLFLSGLSALVALLVYSQIPARNQAPYRHNDGGDVVLLLVWPLAWLVLTLALGLWRQGCRCNPRDLDP